MDQTGSSQVFRPAKINLIFGLIFGVLFIPLLGLGVIIMIAALISYFNTKVVTTDKSVVLHKGWLTKTTTEIPYAKINSVSVSKSSRNNYGSLSISTGNDTSKMVLGSFDNVEGLRDIIQAHLPSHHGAPELAADSTDTHLQALERLAALKERGHLTSEEYAAEKRRLLK